MRRPRVLVDLLVMGTCGVGERMSGKAASDATGGDSSLCGHTMPLCIGMFMHLSRYNEPSASGT
jgi:hypothetical protein